MNLFEYEGKELMKNYGIPVPDGKLLTSENQDAPMVCPFVLKAQVMTGGRGKAGGIKVCGSQEEYRINFHSMMDMSIKGYPVHGLLAEKVVAPERELYLSITLQGVEKPTVILSAAGGMDIEDIALKDPGKIVRVEIDPFTGLKEYQIKYLAKKADIADVVGFTTFIKNFERMFFEAGVTLAEINPLGLTDSGLIAMDSKVVLDNRAVGARSWTEKFSEDRKKLYHYIPDPEEKTTLTFVPLEGEVGMISDGAGTGMLTLDLLSDSGIYVSSFAELGGMISSDIMYRAMERTFDNNPGLKAVIIVLIGGFNRMDNMAEGITTYLRDHETAVPVFCRMCGTMQEEGIRIMQENGLRTWDILSETVKALADRLKED